MEWPRPGDRLFTFDKDWHNNACVDSHGSLSSYGSSYKAAADALVEAVTERKAFLDEMIGPIVFLYRQYIELRLKELVFLCRRLERLDTAFPHHHNLSTLWDEAKRLLDSHYSGTTPPEMHNLDGCIQDFDVHDPQSFAFRYPWDKKGGRSLQALRHINIRHLHEVMARVGSFLDCISGDLSDRLDARDSS
ncbi:MAG: hypothetical protein U0575_05320 [Phycisphaerales bacterium]